MEKWTTHSFDFLKEDRKNCYWFWYKGKIIRKRDKETEEIYEQNLTGTCEWSGNRYRYGFYNFYDILIDKYMRNSKGKYNGQTKTEFAKNYKRVKDIVDKSEGDINKAISLSKTQANRITDEWKAINRAMVAKQTPYLNDKDYGIYESIFEVFFQRAYELGSVSKQDYREYQLERLGL